MFLTLLCLHGWGGSKESFTELRAALAAVPVRIITPDLPGFGEEAEPKKPWTIDDYAAWVEQDIMRRGFEGSLLLLGHSHGGRIALKMAVRGNVPIAHLYLCAPAGIRHAKYAKRLVGYSLAKIGSVITKIPGLGSLRSFGKRILYKLMGVHDYERASPMMQKTMLLVTKEDLTSILSRITVPTDLFWGEDDTQTPLSDGRLMQSQIRGSRLHTYAGVRHGVHRDRAREIAAVIRDQLEKS